MRAAPTRSALGVLYMRFQEKIVGIGSQFCMARPTPIRGVSHYGLTICIKKYLKAKEEL
jgi:hypothetical protein